VIRKKIKSAISSISRNNYKTLNLIKLSSSSLLFNLDVFKKINPTFSLIPVLKANAYGHGLEQAAKILNHAKCSFLAVDGYFEAAKILDISKHKILVLGYIRNENVKLLNIKKCSFVIQDIDSLVAFGKLNKYVNVHIEVNTGMNRLGLQPNELDEYLETMKKYPKLRLEGVMSHLADADNEVDNTYTNEQIILFDELVEKIFKMGFSPKFIHIAQTAGSTKAVSKFANAARIGIGLYGISPLKDVDSHYKDLTELRPVLSFDSTVIKLLKLSKGDKVSYNGIFQADKSMTIAVLPLGYYEGIPRELSNKGFVMFKNKPLPIVGRVCMNHTMIDVTDEAIRVGDRVNVISDNDSNPNSISQLTKDGNIFSYSLMTGFSESTRRIIID